MLRKEIMETVRKTLESLALLVAIPIIILFDRLFLKSNIEFLSLVQSVYYIVAVIYSVYVGGTFFHQETRDKAMEFLLALPLSRPAVFFSKLIPRLTILLVLVGAGILFDYPTLTFPITLLFLYFLSLFLSWAVRSLALLVLAVICLWAFFVLPLKTILAFYLRPLFTGNVLPDVPALICGGILIILPMSISFWLSFRKFDLRPQVKQLTPYYYIMVPALSMLILFTLLLLKKNGLLRMVS